MENNTQLKDLMADLTGRLGLSTEQANGAVASVLTHLKTHLPEPIAAQLDRVAAGGEFDYKDIISFNFEQWAHEAKHKFNELKSGAQGLIDKMF